MALKRLRDGDNALDFAEAALVFLEDTAVFNAGRGATFNKLDEHEVSRGSLLALLREVALSISPAARGCYH